MYITLDLDSLDQTVLYCDYNSNYDNFEFIMLFLWCSLHDPTAGGGGSLTTHKGQGCVSFVSLRGVSFGFWCSKMPVYLAMKDSFRVAYKEI